MIQKNASELLVGAQFHRIPAVNYGLAAINQGTRMTMKQAHELLGHANEATTRLNAKSMGWTLTCPYSNCEVCAISKARQKSVPKQMKNPVKDPGAMLYFHISSPNAKTLGGKRV